MDVHPNALGSVGDRAKVLAATAFDFPRNHPVLWTPAKTGRIHHRDCTGRRAISPLGVPSHTFVQHRRRCDGCRNHCHGKKKGPEP